MANDARYFYSRISTNSGILTKTIGKDGKIKAAAALTAGTIKTESQTQQGFCEVLNSLKPSEALCLGVWEQGIIDHQMSALLTTKKGIKETKDKNPNTSVITRTTEYLKFNSEIPGFFMLDIDEEKWQNIDEIFDILSAPDIWPGFSTAAKIVTASASSHLFKEGKEVEGSRGLHIWIPVDKGMDEIRNFGTRLFRRLVIAGHCEMMVDAVFRLHARSIIDASVWSAERLVFEAGLVIKSDKWDQRRPPAKLFPGVGIDVGKLLEGWQDTAEEELARYQSIVREMRIKKDAEISGDRERWLKKEGRKIGKKKGIGTAAGIALLKARNAAILLSSDSIITDAGELVSVEDILMSPRQYEGVTCPDPGDPFYGGVGGAYGFGKSMVLVSPDSGAPIIHSFAHGGIVYNLMWDFKTLARIATDDPGWILSNLERIVDDDGVILSKSEIDDLGQIVAENTDEEDKKGRGGDRRIISKIKKGFKKNAQSIENIKSSSEVKEGEEYINVLNSKWGLALYGARTALITRTNVYGEWTTLPVEKKYFNDLYANDRIVVFDQLGRPKDVPISTAWMENPKRRSFLRVVFQPFGGKRAVIDAEKGPPMGFGSSEDGQDWNLFSGFLVDGRKWGKLNGGPPTAAAVGCRKIVQHIKNIWCRGDQKTFDAIMGWLADLFQHPENPAVLIPVLASDQGAGKNIIVDDVIRKLCGIHGLTTTNKKDVVGQFASLGDKIFVCLNEAVWGGEHESRSVLKGFVDKTLRYEQKFHSTIYLPNHLHIMIASNADWAAPVEYGDRRFMVLELSNSKINCKRYFMNLKDEIENGGRESFLDLMLKMDLSEYDRREIPESITSSKFMTMIESEPEIGFIFKLLADADYDEEWETSHKWVTDHIEGSDIPAFHKANLFKYGFQEYLKTMRVKNYSSSAVAFYRKLNKFKILIDSNSMIGKEIFHSMKKGKRGERVRLVVPLDSREVCKEKFARLFGIPASIWEL